MLAPILAAAAVVLFRLETDLLATIGCLAPFVAATPFRAPIRRRILLILVHGSLPSPPPGRPARRRLASTCKTSASSRQARGLTRGKQHRRSILGRLALESHPEPTWIVCGAGTGGTSAMIGRSTTSSKSPTSDRDQTLFDAASLERNGFDPSPWDAGLAATLDAGSRHRDETR
jgi:hypothetical protein